MGAKTFTTIAIPDELAAEIDKVVEARKYGYRSRPELIKEAIRTFLRELHKYKK